MGIYISGVKGLPEQVQKNKEDIEQIKEDIADIDFEAIEQLEEQVEENTNDINTIENNIGLQSNAITDLQERMTTAEGDITDLETKTQKITYDEDADDTIVDGDVRITDDLEVDNVHVAGNGTFQNANGSGLHFQEGANDDELVLSNKESGTAHYLTLHADGTLTLDGNPVGGATLYQHNLTLYYGQRYMTLTIINNSATLFNIDTLGAFIYGNSFTTTSNLYHVNGVNYSDNHKYGYFGLYAFSASSLRIRYEDFSNGTVGDDTVGSAWTLNDTVIQIS